MKLVKFCCACAAIALSSSAFSQGDEIIVIAKTDSTGVYREQSTPANPTAAEGKARNKAAAEIAAKTKEAADKARKKARDDCLTREAGQIDVDRGTCKLPFFTQYKNDLTSCGGASNVGQCNLVADARQKEGNAFCDRDANQRLVDLPADYTCQR